jgi:glycosyltransferase involved in cell wall biosynthesis
LKLLSPLVSVVLPVYNGSKYLPETLDSIQQQSYPNLELIIINDGSSDSSQIICEEWAANAPHISTRIVENFFNLGVCNALRVGCACATGEFIAQIGHDDIWLPHHIKNLVYALNDPTKVAAFSGVAYINDISEPITATIFDHESIELGREGLFSRLFSGNILCAPASLFRRSAYKREYWGLHNERLQDYQLWLSLLTAGEFAAVDNVGVYYRIHSSNLSAGNTLVHQSQLEFFEVHQKILSSNGLFTWLESIAADQLRLQNFLDDLRDNIIRVAGYYPPIQLNFLVFLERLHEILPVEACVVRHRVNFLARMGALRKALLVSKGDRSLGSCGRDGAPLLIPANADADNKVFQFLVETGWFSDGRGLDVVSRNIADFFFFVDEKDLDASLSYRQFAELHRRRRIFVSSEQQVSVTLETVCRIPVDIGRIGYHELDKMLRWIEDARMLG